MDGRAERVFVCAGTHDPCLLHYANCGFAYWRRKYRVLGDIPNFENRQSVDGFRKHEEGDKEALSVEELQSHTAVGQTIE